MIKFYFGSVLIWAFILMATINLLAPYFVKNKWLDLSEKVPSITNPSLWMVSIIPMFRFLIFLTLIYMAMFTREE